MYKLTKPLAIALGLVLISVLSLSLAYAYEISLNPVRKPGLIKSLNQGLKTLYFSFINPKGILLGIILVSALYFSLYWVIKSLIQSGLNHLVITVHDTASEIPLMVMGYVVLYTTPIIIFLVWGSYKIWKKYEGKLNHLRDIVGNLEFKVNYLEGQLPTELAKVRLRMNDIQSYKEVVEQLDTRLNERSVH